MYTWYTHREAYTRDIHLLHTQGGIYQVYTLLHTQGGMYPGIHHCIYTTGRHVPGIHHPEVYPRERHIERYTTLRGSREPPRTVNTDKEAPESLPGLLFPDKETPRASQDCYSGLRGSREPPRTVIPGYSPRRRAFQDCYSRLFPQGDSLPGLLFPVILTERSTLVGIFPLYHRERHPGGYTSFITERGTLVGIHLLAPREAPWWVYHCSETIHSRHPGGYTTVLSPEEAPWWVY